MKSPISDPNEPDNGKGPPLWFVVLGFCGLPVAFLIGMWRG
jgi:hypothetical protein